MFMQEQIWVINGENRSRSAMLIHISISNYTIVSDLEMEFSPGMTVITGETGAGKSIMLDALGLCLGDRADPKAVRTGCDRAQIVAGFDVGAIPAAAAWLRERDLYIGEECLLRRVITNEGRSRAYINGNATTLQDCVDLGALLIDIHSQHAHQSLLRKPVQRELLDAYAGHQALAKDWSKPPPTGCGPGGNWNCSQAVATSTPPGPSCWPTRWRSLTNWRCRRANWPPWRANKNCW
jgi:DNA repair protein RecN (Recombination protein N)